MRENKTRTKLRNGETVIGAVTDFKDPNIVEIMGYAGVDFVMIDMEHEARGMENLENMIRAAELVDVTPFVRIPEINEAYALRALEMGALGLVMPHIKTKDDAIRAVRCCRYLPQGIRGMHPATRSTRFGTIPFDQHVKEANEQVHVNVIIEDVEAVENIDRIVAVEGLDAIWLGPGDLSIDLGVPGQWNHPLVVESLEKVIAAASKVKGLGICQFIIDPAQAVAWTKKGVNMISFAHDSIVIMNQYRNLITQIKESLRKA